MLSGNFWMTRSVPRCALLVLSIRVIASRSFWSRPWRDGHPAKANWPLDPALHSLRGLSLSVITASSSL